MNKYKGVIKKTLPVLIILVFIFALYFVWAAFFSGPKESPRSVDPALFSLETYTNVKYKFTLQYPVKLLTKVLTVPITKTIYGHDGEEDLFVASTTDGYRIAVVFEKKPTYRYTLGNLVSVIDVGGRRAYRDDFAEIGDVNVPDFFCQRSYTTIPIGNNEILIDASRCGTAKGVDLGEISDKVNFFSKTDDGITQQLLSSFKFDPGSLPSQDLIFQLSEEQSANRAIDSYVDADLNTLPKSCIMAAPIKVSSTVISYFISEIYNKVCGGDPNTSPIFRGLKVYRFKSLVEVRSTITGEFSSIWRTFYKGSDYTFKYPSDFSIDKNFVYSDNVTSVPLAGIKIELPYDKYPKGLFDGSYIAILINPRAISCNVKDFLNVGLGESFGAIGDVKNGLTTFNHGVGVGVGEGSKYYDVIYTTPKHAPCYGLLLRINIGNLTGEDMKTKTGQYFGDINYTFDQIVRTFKLD
jgi:hypothetical protein